MDEATLDAARRGEREATAAVFAEHLPFVWRCSHALSPSEGDARRVVANVLRRAGVAAETWRDEADVTRWFRHHTIQTVRRGPAAVGASDPLIQDAVPEARAAVVALRKLPRQQQEAFLLHYGERLDDRPMGVAMDCSVTAARTHLEGSQRGLREVAGDEVGVWINRLTDAYRSLEPPANVAVTLAKRHAPRFRGLKQAAMWLVVAALAALIVTVAWLATTRLEW